ncbi:MAG: hypothetical protein HY318_02935 [Armatimonadetes bacterium]|nr:hypothetical protein [Armatimonadota bacterium]
MYAAALSKHEPQTGCYVGAFVDKDGVVQGDYQKFSQLTHKKHASYLTYVAYGRPYPAEWVAKVKAAGAAPHIAFEPNQGLKTVKNDTYLHLWARAAYEAKCPIFLRFASEMNGDWCAYSGEPSLYVKKFRLVHQVMKEEAPNVAMVWTVFSMPLKNIGDYYPGDDYVDWVGINIYSVYVHDGDVNQAAYNEDPIAFLDTVYRRYADRKPIQISEFAATNFCKASARETIDFAIAKMNRLYRTVKQSYPRVKSINWFSYNTVAAGLADNDYSITGKQPILLAYQSVVADPYFLSEVAFDPQKFQVSRKPPFAGQPVQEPTREEQDRDFERIMSTRGAVVTSISRITLRGIASNSNISRASEITVLVPSFILAKYVVFELDGKTIGVTNKAPFTHVLRRDRFTDGTHSLRVIVEDRDGEEFAVDPVRFTFGDEEK